MRSHRSSRGFTLIEILIVVVILGILAAIVIPQFTDASQEAAASNLRSQLQTIRSQIELYNVQNPATPYDPATPLATFWDPLVQGNYLQAEPINPLTANPAVNSPSGVAAAPAVGGAWLWMESSPGDAWTLNVYAVDENGALFSDPDTGNPY
jgi:general secretion pathway protein G